MTEIYKNLSIPNKTWQETVQANLGGVDSEGGVLTSGSGQQYYYPEIYGGILYNTSFKTNDSGARLEIFPQYDPTIGMIVYDNADAEVFKIIIDGTNVGDVVMGNYTGGQGAMWDKSLGTFSIAGALTAGSIAIGTTPNWFRSDALGNIWSGQDTLANAQTNTFAVLNTGILYAKAAIIDGTSTLGGRLASTLATAINASGQFADAAFSTATNTILGSFTFGVSGALQIGTYVNGVSGDLKISPTGILGRDSAGATTFSINGTTGVAVLNGLVVGTNVGLGTAQTAGNVTTIIGNTVTTGFVNALNVNAATVSASISITTPTITGGSITIGTSNSVFIAGANGIQLGHATFGSAPFRVDMAGLLHCTGAVIDSTSTIASTLASTIETGTLANFPSDADLVGYWAFDEGTGAIAYDNSGGSKNCVLYNTPSWITGVAGKALTFASASSQYGIIPALGNQFGAGTMTICFRLKTDTSSSARQRLVTSATYMTAFFGDTGNSGSDMYFYIYNGGWSSGDLFANCILRDDAWHFYVININGATVSIYRDEVLIDTKNTGKTLLANMANALYPVCGTTPSEYVNGSFDELRIYSTILTAAQAYALYKYPSGNPAVAYSAVQIIDGTITAAKITTTSLSAIVADLGSITAGNITLDTSGYIRGGQTAYNTGNNGFWFGYDSGAWKFSMAATATERFILDSTGITISAKLNKLAGDILYQSADALKNVGPSPSTWYKLKEIQVYQPGTYRIKFSLQGGVRLTYGKIYKNGSAVGTERTEGAGVYTEFSEDISGFASGDLIQLYGQILEDGGYYGQVKEFRLYVSQYDYSVVTLNG